MHSDYKKGEVKIKVDSLDDLWYLSSIVDESDIVQGKTLRKIKIGDKDDRNTKIIKKPVFLKIKVENVEFHKYSDVLRISGVIIEGPDDVAKGSHHTFNIEDNTVITIIKERWMGFQKKKLEEASKQNVPKILICILDREEAYIGILKKFGYEIITRLKGNVKKKSEENSKSENFYVEIIKALQEQDKKKIDSIIIASPAFWKDDLMKNLKDENLKKKIFLATCSSCDEKAFNEVLKRQEIQNVLKQDRISKEMSLVDQLLEEISKEGLEAYGFKKVEAAANAGAINILLVTDGYIKKLRQINKFSELDGVMKIVDSNKGEIHIISSDHDGGKKLDGLGGLGAILRYKN